jgi:transposase
MSTITIGVDLAKSVFSVCEMGAAGHVLRRLDLRRDAFAVWLAESPAQKRCQGQLELANP